MALYFADVNVGDEFRGFSFEQVFFTSTSLATKRTVGYYYGLSASRFAPQVIINRDPSGRLDTKGKQISRSTMDGVTAIANILKLEGAEFICRMPSNPPIEAAAIAGIRPIVCRQGRTGIHMADGCSRINNGKNIGIFLAQNGPGAANAFGGIAQAYADSVPILLLPAVASRHIAGNFAIAARPISTGPEFSKFPTSD